jgi:S-disulfanyl-L-cysteine oxidoreductase SoxD
MRVSSRVVSLAAVMASLGGSYWVLSAPASEQVSRGQVAYVSHCASCHGETLSGGWGPPLKGTQFLGQWADKKARSLYSRILSTMPASAPGTLPPKTVLAVTVYLLRQNGVAVGTKATTSVNELNAIVIRP